MKMCDSCPTALGVADNAGSKKLMCSQAYNESFLEMKEQLLGKAFREQLCAELISMLESCTLLF